MNTEITCTRSLDERGNG